MDSEDIIKQTETVNMLNELKKYPGLEVKEPRTLKPKNLTDIAEYILYLENHITAKRVGVENPPNPREKNWVQKDIQIITRESGNNDFLEKANIINLSGRILTHRGERDYIRVTLDEAPSDMRFTLIEEMPRLQKKVIGVTALENSVTVNFSDGSFENVKTLSKDEVKNMSEEWD